MKIEKNDMVMVYDGGGTVPHCKYTGRFGDLTAYLQWETSILDIPCPKRWKHMRWIPLAVFGRMNEGIRKGAFLF